MGLKEKVLEMLKGSGSRGVVASGDVTKRDALWILEQRKRIQRSAREMNMEGPYPGVPGIDETRRGQR